jgi:hypothetical protein
LTKSKDKEGKKLAKQYVKNYNSGLAEILLVKYLERCRDKNSLAFMQFRRLLPEAKIT